ncbi:peptidoglycan DD-metalloendopeptidase family protein, partial [Alistipes sp. OttesenSCG-928-B03]|nr:peptidoglycan DD-metalloendopeptidase family protein [Alistipes sp. OttesenSCG-928-B03]
EHFVYEDNVSDYLVISYLPGDSISVRLEHKDVDVERKVATGHITSSLWNSMVDAGMHPGFIKNFEDIFAWTIDFFGLQDGDHFTVIYDERSIEGTPIDGGRIWGAVFNHNGKDIYAIPFRQGSDKITYWDLTGNSLRKSMLKAPLKYSRISSRFSNSRLHPVLKIRRPHHGVDYAAPMGTPVVAVADGTISFKGWDSKGGGNVVKIKHSQGMQTGYLHLSKFGPGIANGKRVSQGDVIGYVGSTGTSTGPHLDYRVWINGKAIDPLKVTAEPAEPITSANKPDFELIKERILAELKGELPDSMRIVQLDSLQVYRRQGALPAAEGETRDSLP